MYCMGDVFFLPFLIIPNIDNHRLLVLQFRRGIFRRNLGDILLRFGDQLLIPRVLGHALWSVESARESRESGHPLPDRRTLQIFGFIRVNSRDSWANFLTRSATHRSDRAAPL